MAKKLNKRLQKDIKESNIDNLTYFLLTKRTPNWFNKMFRPYK